MTAPTRRMVAGKAQTVDSHDDACIASGPPAATMPLRGRIDEADRAIVVTARIGGTMLLQRIPLNAYKGVVAELRETGEGPAITLILRHAEPSYAVTLETDLPLEEAVARWRHWADRLSVPLLLHEGAGVDSVVRPMLGAVAVRAVQPRRAKPTMRRRPRYAKRRGLR